MRTLFFLMIFSQGSWAGDDIVDLGELKVKGEVRRPSVEFYQLKSLRERQLEELSELTFVEFEKLLTDKEKIHAAPGSVE